MKEIFARLLSAGAAIGAIAAAAGVAVVAIAYALFAFLRYYVGPAGAAAVVAAIAAVLIAIGGLVAAAKARGPGKKSRRQDHDQASFVERASELLRERPILAAGAAIAAGLLAWRNPQLVSTIVRAFEPRDRRRD